MSNAVDLAIKAGFAEFEIPGSLQSRQPTRVLFCPRHKAPIYTPTYNFIRGKP
jgi:hypothetical protein